MSAGKEPSGSDLKKTYDTLQQVHRQAGGNGLRMMLLSGLPSQNNPALQEALGAVMEQLQGNKFDPKAFGKAYEQLEGAKMQAMGSKALYPATNDPSKLPQGTHKPRTREELMPSGAHGVAAGKMEALVGGGTATLNSANPPSSPLPQGVTREALEDAVTNILPALTKALVHDDGSLGAALVMDKGGTPHNIDLTDGLSEMEKRALERVVKEGGAATACDSPEHFSPGCFVSFSPKKISQTER